MGLDPRAELLPVELRAGAHAGRAAAADACARFCTGLVDAVCPYVIGVKVQLAFFEALGADGARAFEDVCGYARTAGLVVIADGKRGDIGSTARAYADAYLEGREDGSPPAVDALTVNPYLGSDSVEPLIAACRRCRHRHLLPRPHVELRERRRPGPRNLRRAPSLAPRRRTRRSMGRGARRRQRHLERRRGGRRHVSPSGRGGETADAESHTAPARDRRPGRDTRGRGPGVHQRAVECARAGFTLDHLRVSGRRRRLAQGCRG